MAEINILNSKNPADCAIWNSELDKFPHHLVDIYSYPEYGNIYLNKPDDQYVVFLYKQNDNIWIYPFLLREIDYINLDNKYFDIETVYGYGGPMSSCTDEGFIIATNTAFNDWCRRENIVAEFIRFNPVLESSINSRVGVDKVFDRKTVSISLGNIREKILYNSKVRNMIRRSLKSGVKIKISDPLDHIDDFIDLYNKTIKVFIEKKLREDIKFNSKEALIAQISEDIRTCSFG